MAQRICFINFVHKNWSFSQTSLYLMLSLENPHYAKWDLQRNVISDVHLFLKVILFFSRKSHKCHLFPDSKILWLHLKYFSLHLKTATCNKCLIVELAYVIPTETAFGVFYGFLLLTTLSYTTKYVTVFFLILFVFLHFPYWNNFTYKLPNKHTHQFKRWKVCGGWGINFFKRMPEYDHEAK